MRKFKDKLNSRDEGHKDIKFYILILGLVNFLTKAICNGSKSASAKIFFTICNESRLISILQNLKQLLIPACSLTSFSEKRAHVCTHIHTHFYLNISLFQYILTRPYTLLHSTNRVTQIHTLSLSISLWHTHKVRKKCALKYPHTCV